MRQLQDLAHKNYGAFQQYLWVQRQVWDEHFGKSYRAVSRKAFLLRRERYLELETEFFGREVLAQPVTALRISFRLEYASPAGRRHYADVWDFQGRRIDEVFARADSLERQVDDLARQRDSIAYQRSLMTLSKRHDILRRDHYTCQYCGRTPRDGAKLEVDHIFPVARGGLTVDSNLQTLCFECNHGKKAKV